MQQGAPQMSSLCILVLHRQKYSQNQTRRSWAPRYWLLVLLQLDSHLVVALGLSSRLLRTQAWQVLYLQCHHTAVRRLAATHPSLADVCIGFSCLLRLRAHVHVVTQRCKQVHLQQAESIEHMQHISLYSKLLCALWYPARWVLSSQGLAACCKMP